jgi:hypothetical protein
VSATFSIGCNGRGAQASSTDKPVSLEEPPLEEQFRLVKEAGVFDSFDRLPLPHQLPEYQRLIAKYELPVKTASWFYKLGRDEALLAQNIRLAREVGAGIHNIMIYMRHAERRLVTDAELVDCYLRTYDDGMKVGVEPAYELHVNMWSEDFRRVTPVAQAVLDRGVPFNLTLDYSHVIFKIGNPPEQDILGIRADVESRRLVLDPFEPGNLCDEWLALGIVRWLQVRAAAPNGPRNLWSRFDPGQALAAVPDDPVPTVGPGDPGRGILYPFTRPEPGEWHSPWFAYMLEPAKEVVRKVLRHHARDPRQRLHYVTTEMINLPDYAHNARFSLIGQNAAIARYVRDTWAEISRPR